MSARPSKRLPDAAPEATDCAGRAAAVPPDGPSALLPDAVFNADVGPRLCAGFVDFNAVAVAPAFAGLVRYWRQHGIVGTLTLLYSAGPAEFAQAIGDEPNLDVVPEEALASSRADGNKAAGPIGGRAA